MGFDCECYSDSAAGKNLCQLAAAEVACAAKFFHTYLLKLASFSKLGNEVEIDRFVFLSLIHI